MDARSPILAITFAGVVIVMFFVTIFRNALGLQFEGEQSIWFSILFAGIATTTTINLVFCWVLKTGWYLPAGSTWLKVMYFVSVIALFLWFVWVHANFLPEEGNGTLNWGLLALSALCSVYIHRFTEREDNPEN